MAEAARVCADLNLPIAGGKLRVLVATYMASELPCDFHTWLTYADPTGEAAVRNVLRGK